MKLTRTVEITPEEAEHLMADRELAVAIRALQRRSDSPIYPRRWGRPTRHKYEEFSANNGWKLSVWVELSKYGLSYKICANCDTHVLIKMGAEEHEFSMRQSDYVNLTPDLQVKPTRTALLIRQPRFMPETRYCQVAAD